MGFSLRSYAVPGAWTSWFAGPSYFLQPNASRTVTFDFGQPYGSTRGGSYGFPPGPISVEVCYLKNGETVKELYTLTPTSGKFSIDVSTDTTESATQVFFE
jgi:hypothetical protein